MEDLQRDILSQNQRLKFLQDQTARVPGSSIDSQLSFIQHEQVPLLTVPAVEISSALRCCLERPLLPDIVIALQLTYVHCFDICTVRQAKFISDLVSALCYAVEEEKYQAAKKDRIEDEGLAREAERLRGERDRISIEESYTAEEEKILSEQAGEMELAIAAQAGSAIERRNSVKALKGASLLKCSDSHIQCCFVLHLLPVDSAMKKLISLRGQNPRTQPILITVSG
jgi:hypothetical protein